MTQYRVTARSPSLGNKEHTSDAVYADDQQAALDAASLAKELNASKHMGSNDWEAWVLIQRHNPL